MTVLGVVPGRDRLRGGQDSVAEPGLPARGGLLTPAPDRDLRDRHPHDQQQDRGLDVVPGTDHQGPVGLGPEEVEPDRQRTAAANQPTTRCPAAAMQTITRTRSSAMLVLDMCPGAAAGARRRHRAVRPRVPPGPAATGGAGRPGASRQLPVQGEVEQQHVDPRRAEEPQVAAVGVLARRAPRPRRAEAPRSRATRSTWIAAYSGETRGSRPEPEAVTASTGTSGGVDALHAGHLGPALLDQDGELRRCSGRGSRRRRPARRSRRPTAATGSTRQRVAVLVGERLPDQGRADHLPADRDERAVRPAGGPAPRR